MITYKLPIGTAITRFNLRSRIWYNINTTREAVYTEKELGNSWFDAGDMYYVIRIPLTDGFDRIKVCRNDLKEVETPVNWLARVLSDSHM